jgi:hypothetical protein
LVFEKMFRRARKGRKKRCDREYVQLKSQSWRGRSKDEPERVVETQAQHHIRGGGKKERERRTDQDQISSLCFRQERLVILVGRHLLQDDGGGSSELYEAPLVLPVLRKLFARLPRELCGAKPMLEVLTGILKALARLVGELGNGRRASLPL